MVRFDSKLIKWLTWSLELHEEKKLIVLAYELYFFYSKTTLAERGKVDLAKQINYSNQLFVGWGIWDFARLVLF